jgi:hypothetical protein
MIKILLFLLVAFPGKSILAGPEPDSLLFDFERGTLHGWDLEGDNFLVGGAPIHANELNQWKWAPAGYSGNYYLESGHHQGRHTNNPDGTWKSPVFPVNRDYLLFNLAGELNPRVRVYLEVNGQVVREAYGNNFYDLFARGWDVRALRGQTARFCIEDRNRFRSLIRVDHILLSNTPPSPESEWVNIEDRERSSLVAPGEFKLVFRDEQITHGDWVCERATLTRGPDGKWHMFIQVMEASNVWNVTKPGRIVHAVSDSLFSGWKYQGIALDPRPESGEEFLLDPFVMVHDSLFYLYFLGAGNLWSGWYKNPDGVPEPWHEGNSGDYGPNSMHLAVSHDGKQWERVKVPGQTRPGRLFTEKPFGHAPHVTRVDTSWVMYYASATGQTVYATHSIGYRVSQDLVNWSPRKHALVDWSKSDPQEATPFGGLSPATPWPEHSFITNPVVFRRGNAWHLWTGPVDNNNLSRYHCLRIYTSDTPFEFGSHWKAKMINKRVFVDGGGKPFQDTDGKWYIFHTNSMSGGVWIAPLYWSDNERGD